MQATILIVDVTGSTPLFVRKGNEAALRTIERCLERVKQIAATQGGEFVSSKGDDVLCQFDDPGAAFAAGCGAVVDGPMGGLNLHAGLCTGDVVRDSENAFGLTVVRAARLSALAQPGELLLDDEVFQHLDAPSQSRLVDVGPVALKGLPAAHVHAFRAQEARDTVLRTEALDLGPDALRSVSSRVRLHVGGEVREVAGGDSITLGRSASCDVVVPDPWISRLHATISVNQGLAEFVDHSSAGSCLVFQDGRRLDLLRQSATLTGAGRISLGLPDSDPRARPLHFEVI